MIYFVLGRIFSFLLDLNAVARRSDHQKDLEIMLLRQQLRILHRTHSHPPLYWLRVSSGFVSCLDNARSQYNGAMLTYQRLPMENATEPLALIVVFPPVSVALAHPRAPEQIQALIDQLAWT